MREDLPSALQGEGVATEGAGAGDEDEGGRAPGSKSAGLGQTPNPTEAAGTGGAQGQQGCGNLEETPQVEPTTTAQQDDEQGPVTEGVDNKDGQPQSEVPSNSEDDTTQATGNTTGDDGGPARITQHTEQEADNYVAPHKTVATAQAAPHYPPLPMIGGPSPDTGATYSKQKSAAE
jgi:hypothetical protein